MPELETERFTVGVFVDAQWAERGIEALGGQGFPRESLTIIARESPEAGALIEQHLGQPGAPVSIRGVGAALAAGPLLEALGGTAELERAGLSGTMRRVGFQGHDSAIFEALTARGGVLVAIRSEPRAADALALLHSYGGGNAAIGAWLGRV